MKFDFSGFSAPEGFPSEVLNSPELLSYLDEVSEKQLNVYKSDFQEKLEKATRDKAIADEKVDSLGKKLKEAIEAGSGDADIDKIKAQLAKAKEESALEFRGQIDAIKAEKEGLQKELDSAKESLTETELRYYLRDGLSEYNEKYSGVTVRDGSGPSNFLIDTALKDWKKSEDGKFKAYHEDGTPMTGPDGAMTRADYFSGLRDRADTAFCFNQPKGGGASGGNGGGAGGSTSLAGDRNQRTQALKNKFPELG